MTATNVLYHVDFDRYYFKKNDTIFVDAILLDQINGFTKAFDIGIDYHENKLVYIAGVSISHQGGE